MTFYETKTGIEFGRSRVQIQVPTNLTGILSWLPSVIKANAGLDFYYHDPFDPLLIKFINHKNEICNFNKEANYSTIKIHSLLVSTPKDPKTRFDQRCLAFLNQRKNALTRHKKLIRVSKNTDRKRGYKLPQTGTLITTADNS